MNTQECAWCGKVPESSNKMIFEKTGFISGRLFCSNKCKTEFHNSKMGQTSDKNYPGQNASVESQKLEFEKQKYEDQKELEEKREREQKAEKLMSEGKKFQAFYVRYISSFFR